jgi:hypothetical protein
MSSELEKFQRDLLESVKQMKRGQTARVTKVGITPAAEARSRVGLSQHDFATLLGPVTCRLLPPGGTTRAPALKGVRPGCRLHPTFVADERLRRNVGMLDLTLVVTLVVSECSPGPRHSDVIVA